jgi:hypothetical protein
MAEALVAAAPPAPPPEVAAWVSALIGARLTERHRRIAEIARLAPRAEQVAAANADRASPPAPETTVAVFGAENALVVGDCLLLDDVEIAFEP